MTSPKEQDYLMPIVIYLTPVIGVHLFDTAVVEVLCLRYEEDWLIGFELELGVSCIRTRTQ